MASRTKKDPEEKAVKPAKSAPTATPEPAVEPAQAGTAPASPAGGGLKLKDLVDQVAQATGGRKAEVKPVIEATLGALGLALATGRPLAVPPLGKLRVVKSKGPALTLKLRLADAAKAAGLALADDAEDG